jgi:hypothetical protein
VEPPIGTPTSTMRVPLRFAGEAGCTTADSPPRPGQTSGGVHTRPSPQSHVIPSRSTNPTPPTPAPASLQAGQSSGNLALRCAAKEERQAHSKRTRGSGKTPSKKQQKTNSKAATHRSNDQSSEVYWPPHNDDTYLNLGDETISNYHFNHITTLTGYEAFMDESIINTSFEALRQHENCEYNSIDIVSTNIAQMLNGVASHNDGHKPYYDFLRARFADKNWIFVPINDGVDSTHAFGVAGSHWSLLIVDRVHEKVYYYDSFYTPDLSQGNPKDTGYRMMQIAHMVVIGILQVLGVMNTKTWSLYPQKHTPHQNHNNQFLGDEGACGPFVWRMSAFMIDLIKQYRRAGKEHEFTVALAPGFPALFGTFFNSYTVREEIRNLIAQFKNTSLMGSDSMEELDLSAVEGRYVVPRSQPPAAIGATPVQSTAHEKNRTGLERQAEYGGGVPTADNLYVPYSSSSSSDRCPFTGLLTPPTTRNNSIGNERTMNGTTNRYDYGNPAYSGVFGSSEGENEIDQFYLSNSRKMDLSAKHVRDRARGSQIHELPAGSSVPQEYFEASVDASGRPLYILRNSADFWPRLG